MSFLKSTIASDIYEHVLKHSNKTTTTKQQNCNKIETNKSLYCEGYSIDSIDLCIYIVDYQLEKAMNLPITYTYLLICPLSLRQANEIYLHLYYCGLWENRYIGIFKQFYYGHRNFCSSCNWHNLVSSLKLLTGRVIHTFSLAS